MSHVVSLAAAFQEAFAHEAAGREPQALAVYQSILNAVPDHPGALLRLAQIDLRHGRPAAARTRAERALGRARTMRLPVADILAMLGRLERVAGRIDLASRLLGEALADTPAHAQARMELGVIAYETGDFAAARGQFAAVASGHPEMGAAWLQLAFALEQQGRVREAVEAAATATTARETSAAAFTHAARLACRLHDYVAAEGYCRDGLARFPAHPDVLHQQGILLKSVGRRAEACRVLGTAAALAPDDGGLQLSLGAALLDASRAAEAVAALERAIALGLAGGEVWDNLGIARRTLGDEVGAMQAFARAVEAAPRLTPALANLLHAHQQACAWDGIEAIEDALIANVENETSDPRLPPFIALGMSTTPAQQLVVARRWARAMLPPVAAPVAVHPRGKRLRLGYVSSDFREHPTGRLMAGLFEAHDRDAFEVHAFSYGRDDGSALRGRIRAAFDAWHDVDDLSDPAVAQRIRAAGIDILVDRKGLTRGSRLGLLAERPAPVQLHYMSFPGTMGFDGIDGIVADGIVIPPGEEAFFHERVWRLPRCYFVNDSKRALPVTDSRAAHGLDPEALVLTCFNQPYKLTRPFFAIWMEALRAAPTAVLWLLAPGRAQQDNLVREAEHSGVDPRRIVFAPALRQDAHMARVGCADLTLDTLPVGQHTTACDALWVGVPMLTCRGATFVGRVGASIMHAVELPDLVTESLQGYRARLLELVREPAQLVAYRQHLEARRHKLPLFDTAGFVRDWEALLQRIHADASDRKGVAG
ncbi:MAG: tetratricopeptide repeat protein [Casimicrobiaceae bacterium]